MKSLTKIAVIAPGKGMGNFISMIGCFQTIYKNTNKKLIILTKKSTSAKMYISNQNFCNEVIYFDENKRGLTNIVYNLKLFFKFVLLLKSLKINKLYILHPSKKYLFAGYVAGIKIIYAPGYRLQNLLLSKNKKYYKSYFSKALDPLIETQELLKKIFKINLIEKGLLNYNLNFKKTFIGICIACSGYERQWGKQNFIKVINYLIVKGYKKFIILSGKDQETLENEIVYEVLKNNEDIEIIETSKYTMNLIYENLKKTFIYIGNDTGIAHLSIALGIKSIIIHGDCPPQHYSSLNYIVDNVDKIRSKTSIKKITFDQVKNKINEVLKL